MKKMKLVRPVSVVGYEQDVDTDFSIALIEHETHDGVLRSAAIPRSDLSRRDKLRTFLAERAVNSSEDDVERLTSSGEMRAEHVRHVVNSTGWRTGGFAWPGVVLNEGDRRVEFQVTEPLAPFTARTGSLKGWLTEVWPRIALSSYAIFAVGVALAAPLLEYSSASEGFVACLVGKSGTGKTLLCTTTMALMGSYDREQLASWNLTLAGLEERLESVRGYAFVTDDTSRDRLSTRSRASFFGTSRTSSREAENVFDRERLRISMEPRKPGNPP
jgi:hypothetical protein